MKRCLCQLVVVALFLIAVQPVRASSPTIAGEISGVELCPEIACGAAIFNGTFQGTVGNKPTPGFFWVAVQHEALLPEILRPFLAASGVYPLSGGSLVVRCSGGTFLTTAIIHLMSA
jgi:hypothetical protein